MDTHVAMQYVSLMPGKSPQATGEFSEFASLLRAARAKARMTQAELGTLIGVDGSSVSAWERGERLPSRDRVYRLYVALNIKERDLWEAAGYLPPAMAGAGQIGSAPQEFPEVEADPSTSPDYVVLPGRFTPEQEALLRAFARTLLDMDEARPEG
jgi:transcriptional regulator with XRE-family HTH domain